MPEGDDVWRTAKRLRALDGETLSSTDFRIPSLATTDLSGRTVLTTTSRGKHLLTRIEGGITLHSHLVMEGTWAVHAPTTKWKRPSHQARVVLQTQGHEAVGFEVRLELIGTDAEGERLSHLGPDLLKPDWTDADRDEAVARLAASNLPLGEALLEQRHLAGIGNIWKCEICFLFGVHPEAPVRDAPLERLVPRARQLLRASIQVGDRITTGNRRPGQRLWVYGRKGPCLRCGTPVRKADLGPPGRERPTYWCPRCQSVGSPT